MVILAIIILLFLFFGRDAKSSEYKNRYPLLKKYSSGISFAANKFNLDPDLIAAVIIQESLGVPPENVGDAGEYGLMQVTPIARLDAVQNGLLSENVDWKYSNEGNILAGSAFLRLMLNQSDSVKQALQFYNAGANDRYEGKGIGYSESVMKIYNEIKNG